jgi:hypothetical protein
VASYPDRWRLVLRVDGGEWNRQYRRGLTQDIEAVSHPQGVEDMESHLERRAVRDRVGAARVTV